MKYNCQKLRLYIITFSIEALGGREIRLVGRGKLLVEEISVYEETRDMGSETLSKLS